jgi:glycosyltransferase involved in cell wall biosynthesis
MQAEYRHAAPVQGRPLISVVTVVFNDVAAVGSTIESVLNQTFEDKEYLVVDGASDDGTIEIVAQYADRIDLIISERDRGIYDAMNKAVARASGEYILFMNSGDMFASVDALSAAAGSLRRGSEQVVFGAWVRREAEGRETQCLPSLSDGFFNHQAILYSRSIHSWHGDYVAVPGLSTADYLYFTTLLASGTVESKTIDAVIASIDVAGTSAGLQTFSQKHAIDYLCGRTSRLKLLLVLLLHPLYFRLKQLVRKW